MGIDTNWCTILSGVFPQCWEKEISKPPQIIIVDVNIVLYSGVNKCFTGEQFLERVSQYIKKLSLPSVEKIIFLFDEYEYTPECKEIERKRRASSSVMPYTLEDIKRKKLRFDSGDWPQVERVWGSSLLKEDLYYYFYWCVNKVFSESSNCEVIIDGCRVSSRIRLGDLDNPCYFPSKYVIFNNEEHHFDGFKLGENDVKILNHIKMNTKKTILIISSDTDTIPMTLLTLRDWINTTTGNIECDIFIQRIPSMEAAFTKNVININSLWAGILQKFHRDYPRITYPIEMLCLLIILSGTDYVDNFSGIGANTVWKHFTSGAHKVLQNHNGDSLINVGSVIGEPQARHPVNFTPSL